MLYYYTDIWSEKWTVNSMEASESFRQKQMFFMCQ